MKIEMLKTFRKRRSEMFGATDGEEQDLRNDTIDDICDKINEIIDMLNNTL